MTKAANGWADRVTPALPAPEPLTDDQREAFLDLVREDPDIGHVDAARRVGVGGSKGQIRQLLAADPEVQQGLRDAWAAILNQHGLGITALVKKLTFIVHDDKNPSQLRAIQDAFAFHGIRAKSEVVQVEFSGPDAGPIQVEGRAVVGLADVVALARELGVGSLDGVDAGHSRRALPAAQDVLPDPPVGERPPSGLPPDGGD